MVLQSYSRAGMYWLGTVLSMWLATAVALLSNSATVKCGVNLKFVISQSIFEYTFDFDEENRDHGSNY